jgi:hypothetical protein
VHASVSNGSKWIVVFTILFIAAAFLLPAVPQPLAYHHFADRRDVFWIHNFLDVKVIWDVGSKWPISRGRGQAFPESSPTG